MSFLLRLLHRVPPLLTGFVQSLLPCISRTSTPPNDLSLEGFVIGGHSVRLREESGLAQDRRLVTIDMLPDDVLVEIFNFYINIDRRWYSLHNTWHALVHVCRRWRYLVFESPRHLNLRLVYRGYRPMSEVLDAWPVLPVILTSSDFPLNPDRWWDNKVAALESEHYNRIAEIYLSGMTKLRWERFAAAMQKPFPELTHLELRVVSYTVSVLPDSFLGGSAPRLRTLNLRGVPFPSIPKLLLSANGLVTLSLQDIPGSGYISPDAMATALTVMTKLEALHLGFRFPRPRPDPASRPLSPPTRFVLPALTQLTFKGVFQYLEDFLARIDAPLLYLLRIIFFMDPDFDVPQLHRLIGNTEEFKTFDHAKVMTFSPFIRLSLYPKTGVVDHHRRRLLELEIYCRKLDGQLSSLAQVCSSSFPLISALEELEIREYEFLESSHWKGETENAQWLGLLDPFTAVKNLYLTDQTARRVGGALQGLSGEREIEVLPALRNLFVLPWLSPSTREAMMPFVATRQLSGHPVAINRWG